MRVPSISNTAIRSFFGIKPSLFFEFVTLVTYSLRLFAAAESADQLVLNAFAAFTVTLHFSVFFATLALITAFPIFFAVTLPFEVTEATFASEVFQVTLAFVPFTESVALLPTVSVSFVLFSFTPAACACVPVPAKLPKVRAVASTSPKLFFISCVLLILSSIEIMLILSEVSNTA